MPWQNYERKPVDIRLVQGCHGPYCSDRYQTTLPGSRNACHWYSRIGWYPYSKKSSTIASFACNCWKTLPQYRTLWLSKHLKILNYRNRRGLAEYPGDRTHPE